MRNSTLLSTVCIIIVLSQCFQANAWVRRQWRRIRLPVTKASTPAPTPAPTPPPLMFAPAPQNPSGIPQCPGQIDVNQILQRGAGGRKKRGAKRQTIPWPFDCSYASIVNYQKSFQFMTPIYDCCDQCKHPTYTQCLASSPSPYWVCPASGLHCIVDCVAKHDPNRQKITTLPDSSGGLRPVGVNPGKVTPPINPCTKTVTVNGKQCIKQLCVSLIQPTNG